MPDKIVIVVQARTGSSRLPGKVLLPVMGESLLYRMIERLRMVKYEAQIIVATSRQSEDDAIVEETRNMNLPFYRGSMNNLLDRHYGVALQQNAQLILKIPSDCPLIDPRVVDQGLDFYFREPGKYDYVGNLHPATFPDGNDVEIMTMACLSKAWKEAGRPLELEHTTPYIWENPGQFCIGNFQWKTGLDYSMSHRFTIDYKEDYAFVKRVFEELYPSKPDFSCEDIIELLKNHPEIYQINSKYAGVNWYRNHLEELKTVTADQTKNPES